MSRWRHATVRFDRAVRADLLRRRWMRWHAFLLGSLCFAIAWTASALLLHAGIDRLALRWPLALGLAYAGFLGLLWLWCRWLLSRDEGDVGGLDGPDPGGLEIALPKATLRSGGGGDFGGGGASASFDAGDVVGGAAEVAGAVDEGAVVVLPLAVAVGIALLITAALGTAVFGLFGVELLLGVAVEIAAAAAGGVIAWRAEREGWLGHALSRTWRSLALLMLLVVALGATIDRWLPQADTLPQALRLLIG